MDSMNLFGLVKMTSLQDQLDEITANTRKLVKGERAVEELFSTGIEERILQVGAMAGAPHSRPSALRNLMPFSRITTNRGASSFRRFCGEGGLPPKSTLGYPNLPGIIPAKRTMGKCGQIAFRPARGANHMTKSIQIKAQNQSVNDAPVYTTRK
jgi:hypothetical protein